MLLLIVRAEKYLCHQEINLEIEANNKSKSVGSALVASFYRTGVSGSSHSLPPVSHFSYADSVMRMESICLMTGNGRASLPKVGWWSTSQPQKQEGKSTHENLNSMYICKSATRVGRCKWPLVVCIRRFPKEQMAGFLAMDYHTVARRSLQRSFATTVGSEEKAMKSSEEYTDISNGASSDLSRNYFGQPVDRTELESMRVDDIRAKLIRKLSEANQHNRHLKRQLHDKEQTLNKYKNELAVMELELQALITLAEEVARYGIKDGSRKINGRYIHSHLALRLEEFHEKLLEQIKGVDGMQFREVALVWYGMAEDVKVMGSFDGWIHGEQMSPESTASVTKFSTTIKLHPGRYEIKFLVDGEWQLSPELQILGEGPLANNLLVVE